MHMLLHMGRRAAYRFAPLCVLMFWFDGRQRRLWKHPTRPHTRWKGIHVCLTMQIEHLSKALSLLVHWLEVSLLPVHAMPRSRRQP